jgi:hypothetical protein
MGTLGAEDARHGFDRHLFNEAANAGNASETSRASSSLLRQMKLVWNAYADDEYLPSYELDDEVFHRLRDFEYKLTNDNSRLLYFSLFGKLKVLLWTTFELRAKPGISLEEASRALTKADAEICAEIHPWQDSFWTRRFSMTDELPSYEAQMHEVQLVRNRAIENKLQYAKLMKGYAK